MGRSDKDTISFIRMVIQEHDNYWDMQREELKKYKYIYETKFWQDEAFEENMIRVETADAFSYIEGFLASLFSKAPAVEIGKDDSVAVDTKLAKAAANRFLYSQVQSMEHGSRLALIYPSAFFKLGPRESESILDKVSLRAVPCWEVIVDKDSNNWEDQRFVGHQYYINMKEAKDTFGQKSFLGIEKEEYFAVDKGGRAIRDSDKTNLPEEYLYIKVVEIYDLMYDKLYFWSAQYANGEKLLEKSDIPVRTYDNKPLPPIAPLYYASKPDCPLEGMSAMSRVYDQFYEKNILRTYWSNAVRRDSRQYLYKEGAFDEEQLAKITAGVDGAMIGIDEDSLDGLIREVPSSPIQSDHDRYLNFIEQDINRGSILAPFSRGEATRATATEITALAQYSASEIGKLARDRDLAIEHIATIYLRILSLLVEEGEKAVINIDGKAMVVTLKDLDAKFKIAALDQGSQPLSDAIKKQNLINLLPVLTQLGVDPQKIKEEIIRAWDLPQSFLEDPEPAEQKKVGPGSIPGEGELQATGGQELPAEQLAQALIGGAQTQGLE